jgi:hypothetical protein
MANRLSNVRQAAEEYANVQREIIENAMGNPPSTATAELLLARMHSKIDALCAERERLKAEQPFKPRALGGRSW